MDGVAQPITKYTIRILEGQRPGGAGWRPTTSTRNGAGGPTLLC